MSFVDYFKELLSRPSPPRVGDDYLAIKRSYMQKHLAQVEAAQHRVYLTAVGGWTGVAFILGIIVGLLADYFGGR